MSNKLVNVEYSPNERKNIVLTNIAKMLMDRGEIDASKVESHIQKLTGADNDDFVYTIKTESGKTFKIKYIPLAPQQKITAINKSYGLSDFLQANDKHNKIVVVTNISPRAENQLRKDQRRTEVFLESTLMINLMSHDIVPKHILLSDKEATEILESYQSSKEELPRMVNKDPVALHFNAKPNQIFRVIRPSEATGYAISYRLVVPGEMKA